MDSNPAEFLFGRIASNILNASTIISKEHQTPSKTLEYLIRILILFQGIMVLTLIWQIHYRIFSSFLFYSLFFFSMWLIWAVKTNLLIKRYSPDLLYNQSNRILFHLAQTVISHLFFLFISGLIFVAINIVNGNNIVTQTLVLVLSLAIYVRYFSDLSLVSVSTGIGLIPNWGGLRKITFNFSTLTEIRGKYSTNLGFANIGIMLGVIYFYINNINYQYQIIWIILFYWFHHKWERKNISSLLVKARTFVHSQSPAVLPTKILSITSPQCDNQEQIQFEKITQSQTEISYSEKLFGKKTSQNPGRASPMGQLGSFAAKSLNRIADKIKREHQEMYLQTKGKQCQDCGIDIHSTSSYCIDCAQVFRT